MRPPLLRTEFTTFPVRRGKVRDVYDLGEQMVIVATDRISAFDWVLPTGIPEKGAILTRLSQFWFDFLGEPNHFVSDRQEDFPGEFQAAWESLSGRTMLVRKTSVFPVECVVRGYLAGSGWKEYRQQGTVCGIGLPPGLQESARLPEAIFTPATKAESGHDENIPFGRVEAELGARVAGELRERSLAIYRRAAEYAASRGVILADTKFEFGQLPGGEIILIDEALTPDSSRYWPADAYRVGVSPPSFDKQFVRNWLEASGWDKNSPPPPLPDDVVRQTQARYQEALDRLTR